MCRLYSKAITGHYKNTSPPSKSTYIVLYVNVVQSCLVIAFDESRNMSRDLLEDTSECSCD